MAKRYSVDVLLPFYLYNDSMTKQKPFLKITKSEAYHAVEDLIEDSRPNAIYITLLILSSIAITSGLLLNNTAILIGGMLITPVLTPVLLLALGIAISKPLVIKQTVRTLVKSFLFMFVVTLTLSLLFGLPDNALQNQIIENSTRTAFLYFLVAVASGVAASFAWARKEAQDILPGVSIAVSLVPPLCSTAMWLSVLDLEQSRFYIFVFLFNLLGIVMGSLVVFSMLKFYTSGDMVEKKAEEIQKEEDAKAKEKAVAKAKEAKEAAGALEDTSDKK